MPPLRCRQADEKPGEILPQQPRLHESTPASSRRFNRVGRVLNHTLSNGSSAHEIFDLLGEPIPIDAAVDEGLKQPPQRVVEDAVECRHCLFGLNFQEKA